MNSSSTRYHFTVPPTAEQGSYSADCSASYMETYRANALSQYNSARAHDGFEPLARMPRGTRYKSIMIEKQRDAARRAVDNHLASLSSL